MKRSRVSDNMAAYRAAHSYGNEIYAHITNPDDTQRALNAVPFARGIDISPTVKLRSAHITLRAQIADRRERLCGMSRPCERLERERAVINSLSLDFPDILPSISGLQPGNRNAS